MTTTHEPAGPAGYVLGLDLGQTQDYTALVVLERRWVRGPVRPLPHLTARHLQRWPLKTPYPKIVEDVSALVKRPPLCRPVLGIDQTGVGAAVVDLFKSGGVAANVRPVLITSGHQVGRGEDGAWHVPKKELVSSLQVLLQGRRLQIAPGPERENLVKELLAFKVKVTTAGNETFEAWRERDHDDLVLAVAIACWLASRPSQGDPAAGGKQADYGAAARWEQERAGFRNLE